MIYPHVYKVIHCNGHEKTQRTSSLRFLASFARGVYPERSECAVDGFGLDRGLRLPVAQRHIVQPDRVSMLGKVSVHLEGHIDLMDTRWNLVKTHVHVMLHSIQR